MQAGKVPFTEEQNVSCEERSRHLLMTSVDKGQARVRLDAAMQAVINTSASDVIKVSKRMKMKKSRDENEKNTLLDLEMSVRSHIRI